MKKDRQQQQKKPSSSTIPSPQLDKQRIYDELFRCSPDAVVFTVLPGFDLPTIPIKETEPNLPSPLSELFKSHYCSLSEADLCKLVSKTFDKIGLTQVEADFLEVSTRQQSLCRVWYEYRKGLITASHFHEILHHKSSSYPTSIVKSIMQYNPPNANIPALKWGRDQESLAVKQYLSTIQDKHDNFKYRSSGLTINTHYPFIGASPDGHIYCECCGNGLIEVKCPHKYRNESPTSAVALADKQYFLKKNASGEISLSRSHKYYAQVQAQLAICEFEYCDFISWTTKSVFIERIYRDPDYLKDNLPNLIHFFKKYLLPEILTQKLLNSLGSKPSITSSSLSATVYCTCRKEESGKMIACDNATCSIEWFHLKCVGIKRVPKGSWFCPNCRQ